MFIAALCEHVFQMLFSGVTIAFFAFRKGADDIPFQNHVADWEIFFVGRKVHIIKTGQDIVVSRYFFLLFFRQLYYNRKDGIKVLAAA